MKKKIYGLITLLLTGQLSFAGKLEIKTGHSVSATGFIENKGQIIDQNGVPNPSVEYLFTSVGLNVQLKTNGFSYDTYVVERKTNARSQNEIKKTDKFQVPDEDVVYHFHRIDVSLIGADTNPTILEARPSEAYFNYFTSGVPDGGVSNVHSFEQVTYQNIYPNIDLQFVCDPQKKFKYNFIIHPGGDPTQIKLRYNGADKIDLVNGEILIQTSNGKLAESIPLSYLQEKKEEVKVNFVSEGENEFSFQVGANYDTKKTLIIDPVPDRVWGSYYGGVQEEFAQAIVLDPNNDVYITGHTQSGSAIATFGAYQTTLTGQYDVLVAKFNSTGSSLIWGTYYGGASGDEGYAIALDASNNIYITGQTASFTGISTLGAYQTVYSGGGDVFVAKFNSSGSALLWATYYGGWGLEYGYSLVLDASNNVYITGNTSSTASIATVGAYQTTYGGGISDTYIAKLNSTGTSLLFGTYYGDAGDDFGQDIVMDQNSDLYVTGYTGSTLSIASGGAYQTSLSGYKDVFVAKFNSNLSSRIWGTYYGGIYDDYAMSLTLGPGNNIYVTGFTDSNAGIATLGAYQTSNFYSNAFIAKFNPTGSSLLWGTYYGGGSGERPYGIALDPVSNVYIAGLTGSGGNISTPGSFQPNAAGNGDAFVAKFNPAGSSLMWGTFYGGTGYDYCYGMTLDQSSNIYIAGRTTSSLSIASVGAYQTTIGSPPNYFDAIVAKFIGCNAAPSQPTAINGLNSFCAGLGITTYSVPVGLTSTSYSWSLPGGWTGTSLTNTISVTTTTASGIISVSAVNACGISAAQNLNITVNAQPTITVNSGSICSGNSFTIVPSGANAYTYSSGSAVVSPTITSSYSVTGTSSAGCVSPNAAISIVAVFTSPTVAVNSGSICTGNSFTIIPSGANTFTIEGGNIVVSPTISTSYSVIGTSSNTCPGSNTAICNVTVTADPLPTISANGGSICSGNSFTIVPSGGSTYTFSGGSATVNPIINTSYSVTGTSSIGCVGNNTAVVNITVNPNPTVSATTSNTLMCVGETVTLTAFGALNYTFIPFGPASSIAISPTVTTTYTIIGEDANGCTNSTTFMQNVSPCTGIDEAKDPISGISIFPNPFTNRITIVMPSGKQSALIYNSLGQIIFSSTINAERAEIDLSGQSDGIYFIRIVNEKSALVKKMRKE